MHRVKDQSGNIIPGIMKGDIGSLVVTDVDQYYKYMREKESIQKINNLENEVQQLKELVQSLLREKNG